MIRRQLLATLAATVFVPALLAAPQLFAATSEMGEAEKKHAEISPRECADYSACRVILMRGFSSEE